MSGLSYERVTKEQRARRNCVAVLQGAGARA